MLSGLEIFFFVIGVILQHIPLYLIPSGNDTVAAGVLLILASIAFPLLMLVILQNGGNVGWALTFTVMVSANWLNWGVAFVQGKDETTNKPNFDRTIHGSVNVGVILGLLVMFFFHNEREENKQLKLERGLGNSEVSRIVSKYDRNRGVSSSFGKKEPTLYQRTTDCVTNFGGSNAVQELANTLGVANPLDSDSKLCNNIVNHLVALKSNSQSLVQDQVNTIRNIIGKYKIPDNSLIKLLKDVSE